MKFEVRQRDGERRVVLDATDSTNASEEYLSRFNSNVERIIVKDMETGKEKGYKNFLNTTTWDQSNFHVKGHNPKR
jgi:hypothetical protein